MGVLNTVDIFSVSCDKRTTAIKIPVTIKNRSRTDMKIDTG